MICSFCRSSVLQSEKPWDYHHGDAASFRASAGQGCVVCHRLAQDIQQQGLSLEQVLQHKAVYRWTLRATGRIRESRESVVLTFRNVDAFADVKLPDRTFYLFPENGSMAFDPPKVFSFADQVPDLGRIPTANQLGGRTDSSSCWSQIAEWVNICASKHEACIRKHSWRDFIPTRLVDTGLPSGAWPPASVRIVDTAAEGIHAPYLTLSHCWGQKLFVELRDNNLQEYTSKGVPWSQIETNRNFVDALQVAKNLGVRYIWIDSLCIIQRQPDYADFLREALRMHLVYRNSYCNIASADSSGKDGGLFRERGEVIPWILPAEFTPVRGATLFRTKGRWRILPADLYQEELLSKILYTRAWVFQERLLSARLLHFSRGQIFWDCAALTACESLPAGLPPPLDTAARTDRHWRQRLQDAALVIRPLGGPANDSLEEFWARSVRYFTACNLGFAADKLNAVWGIAKLVRDALAEDYAAGMWSDQLGEQLAWRVVDPDKSARPADQMQFPSWSWASVRGAVEVAGRTPAWPRWYSVTDHDGGNLEFKLKTYLHQRARRSDSSDWKQELVDMGGDLRRMEGRGQDIVASAARVRPGMSTTSHGVISKRTASLVADKMPELEESALAIRGHIVKGVLERATKGQEGWRLTTEGFRQLGAETLSLRAFPDTTPATEETACAFVILAASRMVGEEWSEADDDQDIEARDLKTAEYAGVGIILEEGGHEFTRIGSLSFHALPQDAWVRLWTGCCEGCCAMEQEGLAGGAEFWLK